MRRGVFLAVMIAGCGWGTLVAIYAVLAVHFFSHGVVVVHPFLPNAVLPFLSARERISTILGVTALGLLGSTALPMVLSRNGRNGAALAAIFCGLTTMLLAGCITVLWRAWDYPYCWICQ
jgi:hypothetical protein